jgi:hypothetical protein
VVPSETIEPVALDPVTVSNVVIDEQKVSFEVDEVGVPILVRVSYFPTWKVEGAEGPYRVAPNWMVVVPTSNEVTLTYSKTPLDWFFYGLTFFGIALCFYWRRRGDVRYDSERPSWRVAGPPAPVEVGTAASDEVAPSDGMPVDGMPAPPGDVVEAVPAGSEFDR